MADTYEDWQANQLVPAWMRGLWGSRWHKRLGRVKDYVRQRAIDALKNRLPRYAHVGSYPYLGNNLQLERHPTDGDPTYLGRLLQPWVIWDVAGSRAWILQTLADAGWVGVVLKAWREITAPDPWNDWWSAFWLWIPASTIEQYYILFGSLSGPTGLTQYHWADGGLVWGGPGSWGSDAKPELVTGLRGLVNKWKPAREICVEALVSFGGAWGAGTWGAPATWDGLGVLRWRMIDRP